MRIPTYNSEVSVSGGQPFQGVADVRDSKSFDSIINSLEYVSDKVKQQDLEDKAIRDYTNMSNADLEITALGETIQDEIASGGKYSDAVKRFNDGYTKIYEKYSPSIEDPRSKAEFAAKSQREGLKYTLALKDSVRTRTRADATSAAANRMDILQEKYIRMESGMGPVDPKARQALLSEMAGTLAPLEAMGVLSKGEGQGKMRGIVAGAEKNIIGILQERDPNSAKSRLEKSYADGVLDSATYEAMLGPVNNAVKQFEAQNRADLSVSNWISGDYSKVPDRSDVDLYFQKNILPMMAQDGVDQAAIESTVASYANSVGMLPTAIENGLVSRLASYSPDMGVQEKASIASNARIVAALDYSVVKKDGGITDDDYTKAKIIASRLDAGIPEVEAVDSVFTDMGDEDRLKVYQSSRKELLNNADGQAPLAAVSGKVNRSIGYSGDDNSIWRSTYEDSYASARVNGASKKEAQNFAKDAVANRYGTFNGVVVENPITSFIPKDIIKNQESKLIDVAKSAVSSVVPDIGNAKVILSGNRDTIAQRNSGVSYWDMDFVVSVVYPGEKYPTPVTDENGNIATIKLSNPKYIAKEERVPYPKPNAKGRINVQR